MKFEVMPIHNITSKILNKKILSESKKSVREKKLSSWDSIRSIGILYVVPEEMPYVRFTNYISQLQADKKEVRTLGLLKTKTIPHYCYPRLAFDYFTPKDVNWFGKPGGSKVDDFIGIPFDVLVNLDLSGKASITYIAGVSKAQLKCGFYREEAVPCLDFMIRTSNPDQPEELMEQIISWLKTLKP